MTDPKSLGELIRERRLARGLSLGQLATAVGRTAATVRSWERNQHAPAQDVLDRLAQTLDVPSDQLEDLMYREPPSLTVVGDPQDEDAVTSESTSVSGDASIETAEGEGDDDTAEVGEVASAPAEAATPEAAFVAASADELGIMPRIQAPAAPAPVETATAPPEDGDGEVEANGGDAPDDGEVSVVVVGPPGEGAEVPVEPTEQIPDESAPVAPDIGDEAAALIDEPTAPIGPPIESAPIAAAPAPGHVGVAVRAEVLKEPELPAFLSPLRAIFDPRRKWLYWIRGALTVVVLIVLLVVLAWAAGELFDGLGAVLDTIESTDTLTDGPAPLP